MNTKRFLLLCCLVCSFLAAKAQRLNGVSVDGDYSKFIVLLNGQQMCEGTSSCFIANLHPGNYSIQVYRANPRDNRMASRELLYKDKFRYSGRGVHHIQITDRGYDDGRFPQHGVMDKPEFKAYCHALKRENFDNGREKMIDSLPRQTRFTSKQCKEIIRTFNFDNNRAKVLKKLYPRVVDPELFFKAIDTLDFYSNKEDVREFIKRYHHERW